MIMVTVDGPNGERVHITTGVGGEESLHVEQSKPSEPPSSRAEVIAAFTPTDRAPAMSGRDEFFGAVNARLEQGAREYHDASFDRPLPELLEELEREALDLAGWGYIVWERIQRMRAAARAVE